MKEAGISCGYMGGNMSYEESRDVMSALKERPPSIKVVFVTPEKIARSDALMRLMDTLHQQGNLVQLSLPWIPTIAIFHFGVITISRAINTIGFCPDSLKGLAPGLRGPAGLLSLSYSLATSQSSFH